MLCNWTTKHQADRAKAKLDWWVDNANFEHDEVYKDSSQLIYTDGCQWRYRVGGGMVWFIHSGFFRSSKKCQESSEHTGKDVLDLSIVTVEFCGPISVLRNPHQLDPRGGESLPISIHILATKNRNHTRSLRGESNVYDAKRTQGRKQDN